MKRIAVLLTSYNRKSKTEKCFAHLLIACQHSSLESMVSIYITDDGSTDGTATAIENKFKSSFKNLTILKGTGSLFWAGGMRNSWKNAIKGNYDGYLLLNDDTYVSETLFDQLQFIHKHCLTKYKQAGIYCGITSDKDRLNTTYGGSVLKNRFFYTTKMLVPNGEVQLCELGNANIMFVPKEVVNKLGILDEKYNHVAADFDYTLKAIKKKIPVLVSREFCGICEDDHLDPYYSFKDMSLKDRMSFSYSPLGLALKDKLKYMQEHFPYRYPFFLLIAWLKIIFPKAYLNLDSRR